MVTLLFAALMAAGPATVQVPVANMYSRATTDADVVSQALYSTPVTVLEERAGWSRIRTPDDYTGWALSKTMRPGAYAASGRTAMVVNLAAHLYQEASIIRRAPLLTLPFESRLEVIGETAESRWLHVRLVDGRTAWVQRGDVDLAPQRPTIPQLLDTARRFLGLPYTWGGTTSFGYDCSGFTQMLCRRRGVVMPRDADQQALWAGMADVPKDAIEPGDLLFFGTSMKKITHTGMMMTNGEFIHATAREHPVLQISPLADPHWTRLLLCVRRPKDNWKDPAP